ncbi:MAG: WYL domain-containing protein [Polyangiales bacterium]
MLGTSARLLRLLTTLQTRRSWSGRELSERLEVTDRTLRRDIDRLRSLGYPVHSTAGVAGGYSLAAGTELPPLMLDDDEGVAVTLALQDAALGGVAKLEEAAARALAKLDQLLPSRAQKRIKAMRGAIVRLPRQGGPTVELSTVQSLAAACNDRVALAFGYNDRTGTGTRREVEPLRVVHMERRWYLVAWDRSRADWRTFRIDRLQQPIERLAGFTPRPAPDDDVVAYANRTLSVGNYRHQVRVRLLAPLELARDHIDGNYGQLTAIDAHSCRFETSGTSLQAIAVWIAVLGLDFVVEEPAQLLPMLQELTERLQRASQAGTRSTTRAASDTRRKR